MGHTIQFNSNVGPLDTQVPPRTVLVPNSRSTHLRSQLPATGYNLVRLHAVQRF